MFCFDYLFIFNLYYCLETYSVLLRKELKIPKENALILLHYIKIVQFCNGK